MIARTSRSIPAAVLLLVLVFLPRPVHSAWFMRGDADASGTLSLSDPVRVLSFLFLAGEVPTCLDAADADDDGTVAINDAVFVLNYLFLGGPPPVTRVRGCWFDTTEDNLGCESHEACNPVGVFLTIQRSGSVSGVIYQRIQAEVLQVLAQLSAADQFGLAFFDAALIRFPTTEAPAIATPEVMAAAVALVKSTFTGHGTCCKPALFRALSWAAQSTAKARVMVHLSNGFNTCPGSDAVTYGAQSLTEVRGRNAGSIPIHAFCIGQRGNADEDWMGQLASQNGGSFVRIIP